MATLKKNGVALTATDKSDVIAGIGLSSVVTIDPETGVAGLNGVYGGSSKLRKFHIALSGRNYSAVNILNLGDSISWGYKATGSPSIAGRFPSVMLRALRKAYPNDIGIAGGAGYISCRDNYGAPQTFSDSPVVTTGGLFASGQNFGLDQQGFIMSASGHKQLYTFTGTGIDLFFAKFSGGGSFSYKVDAGSATTVSTSGTTDYGAKDSSIRGLTAGVHTVEVAWVSGTVYYLGVFAYNGDEAAGIRGWVAAWPSTKSSWWWDTNKNFWLESIKNVNPALVVIEFGPNDYAQAAQVSPGTFKANLLNIISAIKARSSVAPSFVLAITWPLSAASPVAQWSEYVAAMQEIAAGDADVIAFNWMDITTSVAGGATGGILGSDFTHLSNVGDGYIGDRTAKFVGY